MAKKKRYELRPIKSVCIYARYSPGSRQTDQSIEGQLRICKEYADKNDWRVVQTYCDKHKTGTNDDREEFRRMIKDSEKGLFDAVLVWKTDRFGRNVEDMVMNEVRIKRHGVSLVSATEPVAEGPMGAMQKAMLMGMAEFYSATNSENVIRGLRESAMKCQVTSGRIPFGYKKGEDKKFHIDPAAADMVREIFERYDNGDLIFHIMDDVNAKGFKTCLKKPFTRTTMYTILRNERYTGVYLFKDMRIEGGMPQIIDRELFERVQEKLKKNKHAPARAKAAEPFILTTKAKCGHCEAGMVGESGTSRTGSKHYYYCCVRRKNARNKAKACCKKSIRKDLLEDIVIDRTVNYVLTDEIIHKIAVDLVDLQAQDKDTTLLESLYAKKKECEKAINNLLDLAEAGQVSERLANRLREREDDLETINTAIAETEIVHDTFTEDQIIFFLESFRGGDINDPEYRQFLVDTFINEIVVYNDKIVIVYNFTGDDGDGSKVTIEDIENALKEENKKAPVSGSSSDSLSSDGSDNVSLVRLTETNPNQFLYIKRVFCLVLPLEEVSK